MLEEYIGNLHKLWQEKKECGMNDTQKSETVTVETRQEETKKSSNILGIRQVFSVAFRGLVCNRLFFSHVHHQYRMFSPGSCRHCRF